MPVYREQIARDCFFWLLLGVALGGIPLAVFLTEPGARWPNLVVAAVMGGAPILVGVREALRRRSLEVRAPERVLVYREGGLTRRIAFGDVQGVRVGEIQPVG